MLQGKDEATREVVVVEVGLSDMRDGHTGVSRCRFDAVGITLGVDHKRHRAVMDEVAAIPQLGRFDDDNFHDASLTPPT
ncbi:hypothetical protein GCM10017710_06520 [Arthrobacter ramosus]